jgi:hypothetical protein
VIVYLGMPRCASSWLYSNLGFPIPDKESHYLYTNPVDPELYAQNTVIDFSTHNWSMDSDIARAIDPYVSHYIFTYREPLDLAKSYYKFLSTFKPDGLPESFTEFVTIMINGKLLCIGDIFERWISLVDRKKILVYNYTQVSEEWLKGVITNLGLTLPVEIQYQWTNTSVDISKDWHITAEQESTLHFQWQKLQGLL